MSSFDKILAIKMVRDASGMTLVAAKRLIEDLENHYLSTIETPLRSKINEAADRAECYREDLSTLVRLLDYFVAHPAEYQAWKDERF